MTIFAFPLFCRARRDTNVSKPIFIDEGFRDLLHLPPFSVDPCLTRYSLARLTLWERTLFSRFFHQASNWHWILFSRFTAVASIGSINGLYHSIEAKGCDYPALKRHSHSKLDFAPARRKLYLSPSKPGKRAPTRFWRIFASRDKCLAIVNLHEDGWLTG